MKEFVNKLTTHGMSDVTIDMNIFDK